MRWLPYLRGLPAPLITMEIASMRQSRVTLAVAVAVLSGSLYGAVAPPTRRRDILSRRIRLFKNNYTSSDGRTSGSSSAPSVLSVGRSSTVTAGLEGVSGGDGGSSRGTATGPGEISHVATLYPMTR